MERKLGHTAAGCGGGEWAMWAIGSLGSVGHTVAECKEGAGPHGSSSVAAAWLAMSQLT
jgi:hypothetical protein